MLGDRITPRTARALVTGAGSGIGACYARRLAELGYDLVIVGRDRRKLDDTAELISRTTTVKVEILPADLSTGEAVDTLIERLARDAAIEIVVNSAGTATWGPAVENDPEAMLREIDVNVRAAHRITIAASRAMLARKRGAVVNVASLSAFGAQPYTATYCGTKAFLANFSEALHEELRGTGVIIQALCPGFTRTGIFKVVGADESQIPSFVWLEPEVVVRSSLSALRRGKAICVPGLRYKISVLLMKVTPRWINRRIMAYFLGRFDKLKVRTAESAPTDVRPGKTERMENRGSPGDGKPPHTVNSTILKAVP
jgi:uncharacterized protein